MFFIFHIRLNLYYKIKIWYQLNSVILIIINFQNNYLEKFKFIINILQLLIVLYVIL